MRNSSILLSIAFAVAGALVSTGTAWGQFAAPSIAPSAFTAENPAVVKWAAPSAIGFGGGTMKSTTDPKTQDVDYTEGNVGLRLVGETLALGLVAEHQADTTGGISDKRDNGSAAIGLQTGNSLAWGIGYTTLKDAQNTLTYQVAQPAFGVSIRLAEMWFIGAVAGREIVKFTDSSNASSDYQVSRNTFGGGAGFRHGGTVNVHLEVFGISKAKSDTNNGSFVPGETTTGGTLEFTFWSFLIGGSTRHTVQHNNSSVDTVDLTTADIGYAPRQGLAITLHGQLAKTQYAASSAPPDSAQESQGTVQLTYQF